MFHKNDLEKYSLKAVVYLLTLAIVVVFPYNQDCVYK